MESINSQDEFAHYLSLWDAAQAKMNQMPTHQQRHPVPEEEVSALDILQERRNSEGKELEWRDMLLLSEQVDRVFHPERYKQGQKERADVVSSLASASNPVEPPSAGKDQNLTVTKNFIDGKALRELSDLKIRVESLERSLHSAAVTGTQKQENNFNKELASLRDKIEELSNSLSPSLFQNNN